MSDTPTMQSMLEEINYWREKADRLEREVAAARHNEDVFRVLHLDSEKVIEGLREATIEECARVCDYRASKKGKDDEADNEAELCAAIIRELKGSP